MRVQHVAMGGFLCAALLALPLSVRAQEADIGKQLFITYCAICHGGQGTGNGFFADQLKVKPANLTVLRKENNGVFPFERVYKTIDGRAMSAGHGTREMPVWGDEFNEQSPLWSGPFGNQEAYGSFVRGKILALIGYISTLQVK